jgi:DNA-binding NarL/FixJ family response regulator
MRVKRPEQTGDKVPAKVDTIAMPGLRVVIAHRQPLVRLGLQALIANEPDLHAIGAANDADQAVRLCLELRPDVAVIDLSLRGLGGMAATRIIRDELPTTAVIIIAGNDHDAFAISAIRSGAAAYLPGDAAGGDVLRAIRSAAAGQAQLPVRSATRIVQARRLEFLSKREEEVFQLVACGLSNKQLALQLGVTVTTVKSHVSALLAKLGLSSRTQIALYAAREGLMPIDDFDCGTGSFRRRAS